VKAAPVPEFGHLLTINAIRPGLHDALVKSQARLPYRSSRGSRRLDGKTNALPLLSGPEGVGIIVERGRKIMQ
jgi:hypothetical protein